MNTFMEQMQTEVCVVATDAGEGDGRKETSPENGKKGGRPRAPNPTETATLFMQEKLFRDGVPTVRHWRDGWHEFIQTGWAPSSEGEMLKRLLTWLQSKGGILAAHATLNYGRNVLANLSAFGLCGIVASVERPCWLSTGEDARNWIAFSNGVAVDVWRYAKGLAATGEAPASADCTRPVSADLFSADFVPYPWTEEPVNPVKFLTYLRRACPVEDVAEAVRRMMGLILADYGRYEVFWQLYGAGANGKSVLLDIVEALVGRQNACHISLECLAPGTRFQNFPLISAKVNISGELRTDTGTATLAAIEGEFKHATSGGILQIERKGIDKTFERCRARFLMSANSLPTFVDKSDAIWRRLRVIPFDVTIPDAEKDVNLAAKIIADELPAIAHWALGGLADVIRLGHVPDCERGAAMKATHRATCDHEREFLVETYEPGNRDDRVSSATLYEEYRGWMERNGYRASGAGRFKARVETVFSTSGYEDMRINGGVVKGFYGVRRRFVADVAARESIYE